MNEFLQMQIFFLVTTIAVLVLVVLAGLVWWRVERILKNVERISEQAAIESELIRQDIREMRSDIRTGRSRIASIVSLFTKFGKRASKKF